MMKKMLTRQPANQRPGVLYKLFAIVLVLFFTGPLLYILFSVFYSGASGDRLFNEITMERLGAFLSGNLAVIVQNLFSSFLYSLTVVLFSLLICWHPAKILARKKFRFKTVLENLLLLPVLLPPISFAMGLHYFFVYSNLTDSFPGVVLVLTVFTFPYMLRILSSGFRQFPEDYSRCAANLGAGKLRVLLSVELPFMFPSIVGGSFLVFLSSYTEYLLVFLIGGGRVPSYTLFMYPFVFSSDRNLASIVIIIFLLIPLLLFFIIGSFRKAVFKDSLFGK